MREIRVDAVANLVREVVSQEAMRGREVTHHSIPAFDETGGPIREMGDGIGSAKTRVVGGEVLISKLNPRKPRVLLVGRVEPDELAVCSGEFVVLEPHTIDPRYLRYAMLSDRFRQRLEARVQSVTRSQQRVNPDDIGHAWLDAPDSCREQEQIADFLDAETARIDALVALREQQGSLVRERAAAHVYASLRNVHASAVRLRNLLPRIGVGVVVDPSGYFTESGVPFLRGSDVHEGLIDTRSTRFLSPADNARLPSSRLRAGDLVMVRAGYPGRTAVVPQELDGCNCASMLVLRQSPGIDSRFLEAVLNSPVGARQVQAARYGAAQEQINVSDVVNFRVPVPALGEQREFVVEYRRLRDSTATAVAAIDRQIALLRERRQALITAAVTGKLDVG